MRNCVTLDTTGQVLRYGTSDFSAGTSFDSGTETYTEDCGLRPEGVELKYTKIVGGVMVEMTAGEKTAVDDAVPKRSLIPIVVYRGTKEILDGDGAISPTLFSTRLTKGSEQAMTLADGSHDGLLKSVRTSPTTTATITCSLDQDIGAYVSISLNESNHADLVWLADEGYWDIPHYKMITWNT